MDVRDTPTIFERLRLERGLSVYEVERAAPIARKTLGSLEAGTVGRPHARTIQRLARFYNVRPDWLLSEYRRERRQRLDMAA